MARANASRHARRTPPDDSSRSHRARRRRPTAEPRFPRRASGHSDCAACLERCVPSRRVHYDETRASHSFQAPSSPSISAGSLMTASQSSQCQIRARMLFTKWSSCSSSSSPWSASLLQEPRLLTAREEDIIIDLRSRAHLAVHLNHKDLAVLFGRAACSRNGRACCPVASIIRNTARGLGHQLKAKLAHHRQVTWTARAHALSYRLNELHLAEARADGRARTASEKETLEATEHREARVAASARERYDADAGARSLLARRRDEEGVGLQAVPVGDRNAEDLRGSVSARARSEALG